MQGVARVHDYIGEPQDEGDEPPENGSIRTAAATALLSQSIARFNLPGIAASGLQKRDWLVVDGNIKNWLPVLTVGIGDDAGMPRAAPIGKPYLVAFFHSFVSCLSARIAPPGSQSRLGGGATALDPSSPPDAVAGWPLAGSPRPRA